MPLIRISSLRAYTGEITYFNAGQDGVSTCRNLDSLEGVIKGDLTNHSLEWVQLTGEPVTFLTPINELFVAFEFTSTDDKLFRLYLDRGTVWEQYADVWAYQTPTSKHTFGSRVLGGYMQKATPDSNLDNSAEYVVIEWPDYEQSLIGYAGHDLNKALFWTLPSTDSIYIDGYVIERWENGAWATYAATSSNIRYLPIENGYNYRIKTYFYRPEYGYNTAYVSTSHVIKVDNEPQTWATSASQQAGGRILECTNINTGYSVLERTVFAFSPPESQALPFGGRVIGTTMSNTGYDVLQRFVTAFSAPISQSIQSGGRVTGAQTTTNYEVLELVNIELGTNTQIGTGTE